LSKQDLEVGTIYHAFIKFDASKLAQVIANKRRIEEIIFMECGKTEHVASTVQIGQITEEQALA